MSDPFNPDQLFGPALTAARFVLCDGSEIRAKVNEDQTGIQLCSIDSRPPMKTLEPAMLSVKPECANVVVVRTDSAMAVDREKPRVN